MRYYLDMFSGIGGFRLGADWAGLKFDKYYFSEVDRYAVGMYQKRFPGAENLGDIRVADYSKLPQGVWFVSGGFPCQPHSVAGKKQPDRVAGRTGDAYRADCRIKGGFAGGTGQRTV
jgi:DNA (cytosine-5)-methyltransferase 1